MNAGRAPSERPCANKAAIRRVFILMVMVVSVSARGHSQLVQLEGGSSSLMNTQGGTAMLDTGRASVSLGFGWHDGLRSGFSLATPFLRGRMTLGDQLIPFVLPTDVFDPGYYFEGRGAGFRRTFRNGNLFLFGGVTSESLNTPFFDGTTPQNAVGALFYRRSLGRRFTWSSFNLFSGKLTAIQSLTWMPKRGWDLALSGGVGYQQPYGSASAHIHANTFDILASYILTHAAFRRLRVTSPLMTESDGGNLRIEYHPWRMAGVSFSQQDMLAPGVDGKSVRARVNGLSGWFHGAGFRIHASIFRSRGPAGLSRALMVGVQRSFTGRLRVKADYFRSKTSAARPYIGVDTDWREKINAHLFISETYLHEAGTHTFSFGGQLSTNPLDIGVDYQTIFIPFSLPYQPPFRQVVLLTVRCQLSRLLELHAATNYTALGQTRYTAYATAETYSTGGPGTPTARSVRRAIGAYMIRGRVQDVNRKPIFGAALIIGRREVFTDANGVFVLRRKRPGEYNLKLDFPSFLFPGDFTVVSAPTKVWAEPDGSVTPTSITLRRIRPALKSVSQNR